jgi:hypothetical protein
VRPDQYELSETHVNTGHTQTVLLLSAGEGLHKRHDECAAIEAPRLTMALFIYLLISHCCMYVQSIQG